MTILIECPVNRERYTSNQVMGLTTELLKKPTTSTITISKELTARRTIQHSEREGHEVTPLPTA